MMEKTLPVSVLRTTVFGRMSSMASRGRVPFTACCMSTVMRATSAASCQSRTLSRVDPPKRGPHRRARSSTLPGAMTERSSRLGGGSSERAARRLARAMSSGDLNVNSMTGCIPLRARCACGRWGSDLGVF